MKYVVVRALCKPLFTDAGYNISSGNSCGLSGTSKNGTDPLLDPAGLANNGGPTETIALLEGSPAIDLIPMLACTDQAAIPQPLITDQRGFTRPGSGDVPPAGTCGTWSINLQATGLNLSSITNNSIALFVDDSDGDGGCFTVRAQVGNGIVKPHHGVRRFRR